MQEMLLGSGSDVDVSTPPLDNMGVEFQFHWFTCTVWFDVGQACYLLMRLLDWDFETGVSEHFSMLPGGGRGYHQILEGAGSVRVYFNPGGDDERCTIEIPGEVMRSVKWWVLAAVFQELQASKIRFQCSRLDLAFDTEIFTPSDLRSYIAEGGVVRTLAKRDTFVYISHFMGRGDTLGIGSRSSERYLRVYDERGYTRVELETKGSRAQTIFLDLLGFDCREWVKRCMGHLLDFIDLKFDAWERFKRGIIRAGILLSKRAYLSASKKFRWAKEQLSATLFCLAELYGIGTVQSMILEGERRLTDKHKIFIKVNQGALFTFNP